MTTVKPALVLAMILAAQACAASPRKTDSPVVADPSAKPVTSPAPATAAPEDEASGYLVGTPERPGRAELVKWATEAAQAVRARWVLPKDQSPESVAELAARIRIQVENDGTLHDPVLLTSSGNPAYDKSCFTAIRQTPQVTPPPTVPARSQKTIIINFAGSR